MAVLDILKVPHPTLTRVMPPFNWQQPIRDPIELARDLRDTMLAADAMSLSAPQVGIETRCFVMLLGTKDNGWLALFNPTVTETSKATTTADERCRSLPGEAHRIARPQRLTVLFENEEGQTCGTNFENYAAHIVAHELDHLDGKTLHDILAPAARRLALSPAGRALAMRRASSTRRVG